VTAYVVAILVAVIVGRTQVAEHPLVVIAWADVAGTLVIFAFSVLFSNSSFYDPYWSVAPPVIAGYLALGPGAEADPVPLRQAMVGVVVGLWAVRLTYNWWRQWRGLRHEDWRYRDLRRKTGGLYWLVSLAGIHLFPTVLVYLGCLALWPALVAGSRPIGILDGFALAVGLAAIWLEATADRQLARFVRERPPPDAILDRGVWAWCRNPNYLGEIGLWISLAMFGDAADPMAMWIWFGPGAMLFLFLVISIPLKERRMTSRRSGFAAHRERVPKLLPWPRPRARSR
jgi:steroid 5-alpha reductase family enzyme